MFCGKPQFHDEKWQCAVIGEFVAGFNRDMRRRARLKMNIDVLFVDGVSGTEG